MSNKHSKTQVLQVGRTGEGHLVDIQLSPGKDGHVTQVGIDLQNLPVPDRRISCDTVSFLRDDYLVKLLFAQKEVVGNGYLAMVVIQMTFDAIHNFLRSMKPLEVGLKELLNSQYPIAQITDIKDKAQQSAVVSASLVFTGYSGTDACLDFYYASPFSMRSINVTNKISVEPVVRVNVPTHLLGALFEGLKGIASTLPTFAGKVKS